MLAGLITRSNTQQKLTSAPAGMRGTLQTALPGRTKSPPGAAKPIADWPKLVYDAGREKSVAPLGNPTAKPSGPVAATEITLADWAGTEIRLAVWSRSIA